MDSNERTVLQRAFLKTEELFRKHKSAESWSDNIIRGSEELRTKRQWKHFYSYLANPHGYNEAAVEKQTTIGEEERTEVASYPDNMVVTELRMATKPSLRLNSGRKMMKN